MNQSFDQTWNATSCPTLTSEDICIKHCQPELNVDLCVTHSSPDKHLKLWGWRSTSGEIGNTYLKISTGDVSASQASLRAKGHPVKTGFMVGQWSARSKEVQQHVC